MACLNLKSVVVAPSGSKEAGSARIRLAFSDLEIIKATVGDILKVSLCYEGNSQEQFLLLCIASVFSQASLSETQHRGCAILDPSVQLPLPSTGSAESHSSQFDVKSFPSKTRFTARVSVASRHPAAALSVQVLTCQPITLLEGVPWQLEQLVVVSNCLIHIGSKQKIAVVSTEPADGPLRITPSTGVTIVDTAFKWPLSNHDVLSCTEHLSAASSALSATQQGHRESEQLRASKPEPPSLQSKIDLASPRAGDSVQESLESSSAGSPSAEEPGAHGALGTEGAVKAGTRRLKKLGSTKSTASHPGQAPESSRGRVQGSKLAESLRGRGRESTTPESSKGKGRGQTQECTRGTGQGSRTPESLRGRGQRFKLLESSRGRGQGSKTSEGSRGRGQGFERLQHLEQAIKELPAQPSAFDLLGSLEDD
eukprot:jgi/Botrbrau1/16870/Bobra.150_2s0089.1